MIWNEDIVLIETLWNVNSNAKVVLTDWSAY